MKKILTILLLAALCLTLLPAAALAGSDPTEPRDAVPAEEAIALSAEEPAEEPDLPEKADPAEDEIARAEEPGETPEDPADEPEESADEAEVSEEPAEDIASGEDELVSEEPPLDEAEPEAPTEDGVTPDAFRIGSTTYTTLNAAIDAAKNGSSKVIIVDKSTTLTAGSYTIPSGVTLVVPYDDASSLTKYRTLPKEGTGEPYEFVRLTLSSGATLTVASGATLCVGAGYSLATSHYASVAGAYGRIDLASGSSIVLESTARLFAYGFITGSGAVIANSGSKLWEYMEVGDFRGRDATISMLENTRHVFPFTQYFVQNIEATLRLYGGAVETAIVPDSGTGAILQLPFINNDGESNGLFQLTSGYLERKYNASVDRVSYVIRGNGQFSINSTVIFGYDSSAFVFPICSNLSFTLTSGSSMTINNDVMLLPGSSFIIESGASMTVRNRINVYVIDSSDWNGKGFVYSEASWGNVAKNCRAAYYVPDRVARCDARDPGDARLVINGNLTVRGNIYTSQGGATVIEGSSSTVTDRTSATGSLYAAKGSDYVSIPLVNLSRQASTPGDLDRNGKTEALDAALLLEYLVGRIDESSIDTIAADVNNDGSIDAYDAYRILKK